MALTILPASAEIDFNKAVTVPVIESEVQATPGFADALRTTVIAYLKEARTFPAVSTPEDAKDKPVLEMIGRVVEFKSGNMATRMLVGLGAGRASAAIQFELKDQESGKVMWRKTMKEKASVWSNAASSTSQRAELPEKIAKTLVEELRKGRRL